MDTKQHIRITYDEKIQFFGSHFRYTDSKSLRVDVGWKFYNFNTFLGRFCPVVTGSWTSCALLITKH